MRLRSTGWWLLPCGAGAATGLLAAGLAGSGPGGLALAGVLCAVLLTVLVPLRAVTATAPRASLEGVAVAAGAGLTGLALHPGWGAVGAAAYLALLGLALAGWTRALRGWGGQPLVSSAALAVLSLPYWGAGLLGLLDDSRALDLIRHGPLAVLCGSCAGVDILRRETLYRLLPLGQALPYAYPGPLAAGGLLVACAAAGWALLAARHAASAGWIGRAGPAPAAGGAALLVLLGAPAPAEAQLFPDPGGAVQQERVIGDLVTRVNLGYYVPLIFDGHIQLDTYDGSRAGTKLDFLEHLELEPIYMMPTFEVALSWENAGQLLVQYAEAEWRGSDLVTEPLLIEERTFKPVQVIETRYRFRTIALVGRLDIPVNEYVNVWLMTTQRYVFYELRLKELPDGQRIHNSLETLLPVVGAGADVLIYEQISVFGSLQYLDFRTEIFGGKDYEHIQRYREWRAGVRLALVEHANVTVEFYSLETHVREAEVHEYQQKLQGIRVQVAILF